MPSRRRPKAPPPRPLSDAERFAQSIRESEEADRRARQAAIDRKAETERRKVEENERAIRLSRAQEAHRRAVDGVKEAKRTGRGVADADAAWRRAKAELLELETGKRPTWATLEPDAEQDPSAEDVDGSSDDEGDGAE